MTSPPPIHTTAAAPTLGAPSSPVPKQKLNPALIIALITAFPVGVTITFSVILVALNFEYGGQSATMTGFGAAAALAGVLVGIPLLTPLTKRFSSVDLTIGGLVVIFFACIAMALGFNPWIWILLRFIIGMCASPEWTFSEAWVVSCAPRERRGFWVACYSGLMALGYATGPAIVAIFGHDPILFLFPASLVILNLALFLYARQMMPDLPITKSSFSMSMLLAMPFIAVAGFVAGIGEGGSLGLVPVWGLRSGMSQQLLAECLVLFAVGSALGQIPAGKCADKFGANRVLIIIAAISCAIPLFLLAIPVDAKALLLVVFFLWGALGFAIYTVSLVAIGNEISTEHIARANGLFIIVFSLGVVVGPPVIGFLIETLGLNAFPLAMAAAPLLLFAAARLPRKPL